MTVDRNEILFHYAADPGALVGIFDREVGALRRDTTEMAMLQYRLSLFIAGMQRVAEAYSDRQEQIEALQLPDLRKHREAFGDALNERVADSEIPVPIWSDHDRWRASLVAAVRSARGGTPSGADEIKEIQKAFDALSRQSNRVAGRLTRNKTFADELDQRFAAVLQEHPDLGNLIYQVSFARRNAKTIIENVQFSGGLRHLPTSGDLLNMNLELKPGQFGADWVSTPTVRLLEGHNDHTYAFTQDLVWGRLHGQQREIAQLLKITQILSPFLDPPATGPIDQHQATSTAEKRAYIQRLLSADHHQPYGALREITATIDQDQRILHEMRTFVANTVGNVTQEIDSGNLDRLRLQDAFRAHGTGALVRRYAPGLVPYLDEVDLEAQRPEVDASLSQQMAESGIDFTGKSATEHFTSLVENAAQQANGMSNDGRLMYVHLVSDLAAMAQERLEIFEILAMSAEREGGRHNGALESLSTEMGTRIFQAPDSASNERSVMTEKRGAFAGRQDSERRIADAIEHGDLEALMGEQAWYESRDARTDEFRRVNDLIVAVDETATEDDTFMSALARHEAEDRFSDISRMVISRSLLPVRMVASMVIAGNIDSAPELPANKNSELLNARTYRDLLTATIRNGGFSAEYIVGNELYRKGIVRPNDIASGREAVAGLFLRTVKELGNGDSRLQNVIQGAAAGSPALRKVIGRLDILRPNERPQYPDGADRRNKVPYFDGAIADVGGPDAIKYFKDIEAEIDKQRQRVVDTEGLLETTDKLACDIFQASPELAKQFAQHIAALPTKLAFRNEYTVNEQSGPQATMMAIFDRLPGAKAKLKEAALAVGGSVAEAFGHRPEGPSAQQDGLGTPG